MSVEVSKAPEYVRELLKNDDLVLKVAGSFDEIEAIILEAQRNVTKLTEKGEEAAMIRSIDHLLKHFRLFRDVGLDKIKNRETEPEKSNE